MRDGQHARRVRLAERRMPAHTLAHVPDASSRCRLRSGRLGAPAASGASPSQSPQWRRTAVRHSPSAASGSSPVAGGVRTRPRSFWVRPRPPPSVRTGRSGVAGRAGQAGCAGQARPGGMAGRAGTGRARWQSRAQWNRRPRRQDLWRGQDLGLCVPNFPQLAT